MNLYDLQEVYATAKRVTGLNGVALLNWILH